ncbi:hypothetical protein SDC9_207397 [bioreactor metagenome]|uniref:Uncharacterized protein n=1 Tax=bioreactor metagenome TaxID=1076179 RepID=A0A645J7I9_9ZZZZ
MLYEAFKAGVADLGAKEAVEISGLSNEKLKPLLDRTWRLTHSKLQRQRIEGAAEALPYLMLDVTPGTSVRPQCIEMDGIARRVDDPYWRENYPPCDRIDCMCRVIQLSDRQVQREGITVLPTEVGKPDANP